jgi:sulfite oxidase
MLHLLKFPYNGEPPKRLVTDTEITPNSLHFVRNHGGIPRIDKEDYSFLLDGLVANPKSFTLDDLMDESKFPRMEKTITIQCSGTRRIEQIRLAPGQGDEIPQAPWAEGEFAAIRPGDMYGVLTLLGRGHRHCALHGYQSEEGH